MHSVGASRTVPDAVSERNAAPGLTRVGVAGATGLAGQELLRLLARHPAVRVTLATSSTAASAARRLPALGRIWDGTITPLDVEQLATEAHLVFLALPDPAAAPGAAAGAAARWSSPTRV